MSVCVCCVCCMCVVLLMCMSDTFTHPLFSPLSHSPIPLPSLSHPAPIPLPSLPLPPPPSPSLPSLPSLSSHPIPSLPLPPPPSLPLPPPHSPHKGVMAQSVLRRHNVTTGPRGSNPDPLSRPDDTLVLCIGDDDADEAMFKAVKEYVNMFNMLFRGIVVNRLLYVWESGLFHVNLNPLYYIPFKAHPFMHTLYTPSTPYLHLCTPVIHVYTPYIHLTHL